MSTEGTNAEARAAASGSAGTPAAEVQIEASRRRPWSRGGARQAAPPRQAARRPCDFTEHIHGATTAADGTFEVQDVLPGRYRMAVAVTPRNWRYLSVDECCLATRPGAPQDLGTIDAKEGDKEGW